MNSRKWQIGMVAMIVLTLGAFAVIPFVWRLLRLQEKSTMIVLVVVLFLEACWFTLSTIQGDTPNGGIGGLFGVLTILVAAVSAAWIFRPYTKEEIVPERGI
jgi:hypothetical protein